MKLADRTRISGRQLHTITRPGPSTLLEDCPGCERDQPASPETLKGNTLHQKRQLQPVFEAHNATHGNLVQHRGSLFDIREISCQITPQCETMQPSQKLGTIPYAEGEGEAGYSGGVRQWMQVMQPSIKNPGTYTYNVARQPIPQRHIRAYMASLVGLGSSMCPVFGMNPYPFHVYSVRWLALSTSWLIPFPFRG